MLTCRTCTFQWYKCNCYLTWHNQHARKETMFPSSVLNHDEHCQQLDCYKAVLREYMKNLIFELRGIGLKALETIAVVNSHVLATYYR